MFQCPRCSYKFQKKGHYINHVNKKYICDPILEDIEPTITNFIEVDHRHKCDNCKKTFRSKYGYDIHVCKQDNYSIKNKNINDNNNIKQINSENVQVIDKSINEQFIKENDNKQRIIEKIENDKPYVINNYVIDLNNTFDGFINGIIIYSENIKGDLFEIYCYQVLLFNDTNKEIENLWRHKDIPENIKKDLKITQDKGIDILVKYKNNTYKGVQCKFRSDISSNISYKHCATFIGQIYKPCINGGIYMVSTKNVCSDIKEHYNKIEFYTYNDFIKLDENDGFYNQFQNFVS